MHHRLRGTMQNGYWTRPTSLLGWEVVGVTCK